MLLKYAMKREIHYDRHYNPSPMILVLYSNDIGHAFYITFNNNIQQSHCEHSITN